MSDSPEQLPDSPVEDGPHENAVEHLPQRALVDDEPTGAGAFRARVRRYALPGVLTLSVLAGLGLAGVTGPRPETVSAAPAAVTAGPEARTADQTSRDQQREAIDVPTPESAPTQDPAPETGQPVPESSEVPLMSVVTSAPSTTPAGTPTAAGTRYATATVNVRAQAGADSDKIGSVTEGDAVSITGKTASGFSQVLLDGKTGWVSSEFLSSTKPTATASAKPSAAASSAARSGSASPSKTASSAKSSGSSAASVPTSGNCSPLPGVQASTERLHQVLCAKFPGVSSYGGVRSDADYHHPSGLAIDAMTSNTALGWEIANWVRANGSSYGVTQVIYSQKIWTTQRGSEGWRSMSDRGSATANHMDHVHISIN